MLLDFGSKLVGMVAGFPGDRELGRYRRGLELLLLALPPRRLIEERCHLLHLLTDDIFEDWRSSRRWSRLAPLPAQLWRLQRWGRWLDCALPPPPTAPPPPCEPS